MAQSGFTPILCYASGTATNVPLAANLTSSASGAELALNYADGKLYFKNSSGVVTLLASSATVAPVTTLSFGTTGLTPSTATSGAITVAGTLATTNGGTGLTSFTANRVFYASSTSAISQSANLTFDGTTLVAANFTDSSLTSGRVTYATTGGNLTDSANLLFDGTTLTANALTTTSTVTINGGTANGVAYLNGSKVLTSGSALTFDGTRLGVGGNPASTGLDTGVTQAFIVAPNSNTGAAATFIADSVGRGVLVADQAKTTIASIAVGSSVVGIGSNSNTPVVFNVNASEQMRLTSTGLGIGTSSMLGVSDRLAVVGGNVAVQRTSGITTILGDNTQRGYVGTISNHTLSFLTNSTEQMFLTASGNLGLGVTPSAWLGGQVIQLGARGGLMYRTDLASTEVSNNSYYNSGVGYVYQASATAALYRQASSQHLWFTAPSGTAGNAISFTQAMTLDASANLCIGTTNISDKVTVFGGVALQWDNDRKFWMSFDNTYRNGVRLDAATRTTTIFATGGSGDGGSITFNTRAATGSGPTDYGTERMRLDSSGNLGLGVTPSAWSGYGLPVIQLPNQGTVVSSGSGAYWGANWYYSGGSFRYNASDFATYAQQISGQFRWYTAPSGTAGNAITFTQAMTLDASGNLLVGGTSTIYGAGGRGNIEINGSSNSILALTIAGSSTNSSYLYNTSTDLEIAATGSRFMRFTTNGSERARIDSSGNLLVGTTSTGFVNDDGWTKEGASVVQRHSSSQTSGTAYTWFTYNASSIGSITQNGTTAVAYNTSSDYRLKENIQPMTGALAKVAALKPCTYKWKADGSDGEGFIAHELAEVCPQAVTGSKDAVNEDGSIKPQGIDTSFLVATLTAAIQELKAEFDAYKATHP